MKYTGKIIVLAFPDTFVQLSDELMCKILPLVGLGTRTHIKAGHAALVLIENQSGNAYYYDFGRYITPKGKGRVRGANTDVELEIPFQARVKDQQLENLEEFLLWLDAHPEKTHGSGRLVASLCEDINFEKALAYIKSLQNQGSVPYKAFGKTGSNCARFVTETILSATDNRAIRKHLAHNKKFTPSTVGNVEKSANSDVFQVLGGKITPYDSTALRENLTNYFDKKVPNSYTMRADYDGIPEGAQLLQGTGSSAYFKLEQEDSRFLVTRFTEEGVQDFQGYSAIPDGFILEEPYQFIYDSNCEYCTVKQGGSSFRLELERKKETTKTSLVRRVHSA